MKKRFSLTDLDCASCAAKMESAIRKIPGVNSVSISFMTRKLVLDADDGCFDEIVEQAAAICRNIEPACEISR